MKLELKHLAPYLPYSLEAVACRVEDCQFVLEKINQTKAYGYTKYGNFVPIGDLISEIKPILRPIQEVELFFEDKWALGDDEDVKKYLDADFLWQNGNIEVNEIQLMQAEYLPYGTLQVLLKYHFDIFGLIKQGLAIDINTLSE